MEYWDVHSHHLMIEDFVRTGAYEAAILETVRAGARVLDFGCGTGILSIFAARAGATRVYAVDRSPIIAAAREIAARNGAGVIEFVDGEGAEIDLPSRVDVIVSEWMGHFLFCEWMLEPLLSLRDRFLAPSGRVLPAAVTPKIGLVRDPGIRHVADYFSSPRWRIDFRLLADWALREVVPVELEAGQVTSDVIDLGEIDLTACRRTPTLLSGYTRIEEAARIFALAGWFDARLTDAIGFGTGPFDPPTHWRQLLFPLSEPLDLRVGERLEVEIRPARSGDGDRTTWRWAVTHAGCRMEMDDFSHRAVGETDGQSGS